jgi:ribosomal protein S27E
MLIYKITSPNTDLVYVGHTDNTHRRLCFHRSHYKAWLAGKSYSVYCSSYKVLEHGDYSISTIEETEDADREGYWIKELNACNERKLDYDSIAWQKDYYEENKDRILARKLEKIPCDNCGRIVCRDHMSRHKRTDRCVNKEPIREKAETIACDHCGRVIIRNNITKHKRTKICMSFTIASCSNN